MDVPLELLSTFIETRAHLHLGNMIQNRKCPFCPIGVTYTYLHYINDCTLNKGMDPDSPSTHLTHNMLLHVLGGSPCTETPQGDIRQLMIQELRVLPYFHQTHINWTNIYKFNLLKPQPSKNKKSVQLRTIKISARNHTLIQIQTVSRLSSRTQCNATWALSSPGVNGARSWWRICQRLWRGNQQD
jgi:hypothetical protein